MFKIYICTIALFVSLDAREFYVDEDGRVYITPQDNRKELDPKDSKELENFKLYVDADGAIFLTPSNGRKELVGGLDSKEVAVGAQKSSSEKNIIPTKEAEKKDRNFMKNIEFSGVHYFGYTYANPKNHSKYAGSSGGFDMRRNYIGLKAFLNEKDYFRVTLDATKELASNTSYANIFIKYAYLYLDDILPYSGIEIGIAHRPWIDYEEHSSWFYRSFNKVFIEDKFSATSAGMDLVGSADLGVNLKSKTEFFSSEIGIYNGEGYHSDKKGANQKNDSKLSAEWRFSVHLYGDGKKISKQDRVKQNYADISTFGMISKNHNDNDVAIGSAGEYNREFYGIHAVYNEPLYLLSAQYIIAKDRARNQTITDTKEYKGYSVNALFRASTKWSIVGRYDDYSIEKIAMGSGKKDSLFNGNQIITAIAYKYNEYVTFIGSSKIIKDSIAKEESKNIYMLSTEIKW